MASFRKNGWDIEPITVNKDYVIISGHHRLAAAVQAEIDIKYTIADVDYTSTQLQDISSTQKKWTERDVIASKAKAGSIAHQNYIQLDKKYVATKILKPNTLVAVITNNYTTGSVAKIKSDDFEFPLEEFIKVDEKLQILSDVLEPARNSKRSSAFLEKAALFMLDNGAVPSTLKDKLDKYSSTIPKIPSIEVGIETLEGIYNRRSAKKMYFSSAYREYLDNRNKKAMINSFYKYGPAKKNYGEYKCMDALKNIELRLQKYKETGNTEYLVDVANFAMLEFMHPSIPGAKYTPTGDATCEIAGFGVNQLEV